MADIIVKRGYPITKPFETMDEVDDYFAEEKLTCLLCGGKYISLHAHLGGSHKITADKYREQYGIPWNRGLAAKSMRDKLSRIIKDQRKKGIIPHRPTPEHIEKMQAARKTNSRPMQNTVRDNISKKALKTHGRTERWGKNDIEEFLNRIKSGRTITEVGKDKDMPCREIFYKYIRDNPEFNQKFLSVWENVQFDVQIRGQKTGERFKRAIVKLRTEGKTWPEISKELNVKESTPKNIWHKLKINGELDQYK